VSEKLDVREEYKEKIYIWKMKGFDTTVLKPLLEGDVEKLKKTYDEFIKKVERLIELQKEFGSLNTSNFPDEAMKIESMLFSPEHVDDIEELIAKIKQVVRVAQAKRKRAFEDYLIGACNKDAYDLYKEQVVKNLGEKFNPFMVFGKEGTGRTRFLEEVRIDLESVDKVVCFVDLGVEDAVHQLEKTNSFDVLIMDNFHNIFSYNKELRKKVFDIVRNFLGSGKAVIFSSATFSSDVVLEEDEKSIFELGIEVALKEPSSDVVESYIKTKLEPDKAESLIGKGLPEFAAFFKIDDFISDMVKQGIASVAAVPVSEVFERTEAPAEQEVVPLGLLGETIEAGEVASEETSVVSLGLPGEEVTKEETGIPDKGEEIAGLEVSQQTVEQTSPEKLKEKTEPPVVKGEPLKEIREERFIVKEIRGELIEDNY
jgi:hypothetical protein